MKPLTREEVHALYKGDTSRTTDPKEDDQWWLEHGVEHDEVKMLGIAAAAWLEFTQPDASTAFLFTSGVRLGLLIGAEVCKREQAGDPII